MSQEVKIKLYGGLRQYSETDNVVISLDLPQKVSEIKEKLKAALPKDAEEILSHAALATSQEILADHAEIMQFEELSVLPPVCGG